MAYMKEQDNAFVTNENDFMDYVCCSCFEDEGLCEFIESYAEATECSFCGRKGEKPIAAHVDKVAEHFRMCVEQEYEDATDWLPYESREGGFIGRHWDPYDFIADELQLSLPNDNSGELSARLLQEIDGIVWCELNPYGLNPYELAKFSWQEFCRVVKHERRFFFRDVRLDDREILTPAGVLERIFEYAELTELFVEIDPNVPLFRAQQHCPGNPLTKPEDLGPPPEEKASQNRMSPAGISMFYVSEDPDTALAEIRARTGEFSVGCFRLTRPALVLDLSAIPPIPSLFARIPETTAFNPRRILMFLHEVQRRISEPICNDDRVHIDYVPTQVVTEYIRCLPPLAGRLVEGIKYPSSVAPGCWSAALFANQRNVVGIKEGRFRGDQSNRWIRLASSSTYQL